jgi:hypothetical protein
MGAMEDPVVVGEDPVVVGDPAVEAVQEDLVALGAALLESLCRALKTGFLRPSQW